MHHLFLSHMKLAGPLECTLQATQRSPQVGRLPLLLSQLLSQRGQLHAASQPTPLAARPAARARLPPPPLLVVATIVQCPGPRECSPAYLRALRTPRPTFNSSYKGKIKGNSSCVSKLVATPFLRVFFISVARLSVCLSVCLSLFVSF